MFDSPARTLLRPQDYQPCRFQHSTTTHTCKFAPLLQSAQTHIPTHLHTYKVPFPVHIPGEMRLRLHLLLPLQSLIACRRVDSHLHFTHGPTARLPAGAIAACKRPAADKGFAASYTNIRSASERGSQPEIALVHGLCRNAHTGARDQRVVVGTSP